MITSCHRRAPGGFTLIELAIASTLAALVAGAAAALLFGLFGLDRQSRDNVALTTARARLGDRFRADVATAAACTPLDEQQPEAGIVLKGSGGQSVQYLAAQGEVRRIDYAGDKIERREIYRLGDGGRAIFKLTTDSPPRVTCTVEFATPSGRADQMLPAGAEVRRALTIAAVLARDGRLVEAVQHAASENKTDPTTTPPSDTTSPDTTTPETTTP
jgi:prepilin-type N-terminal cleavage/methylation domain-containing protein